MYAYRLLLLLLQDAAYQVEVYHDIHVLMKVRP